MASHEEARTPAPAPRTALAQRSFFKNRQPEEPQYEVAGSAAVSSKSPGTAKKAAAKPQKKAAVEDHGDELGRLKRLGFSTLAECLLSIPKAYYDYTAPKPTVTADMVGASHYLVVRAKDMQLYQGKAKTDYFPGATRVEIICTDSRGTEVVLTAFGTAWPWKWLGEELATGERPVLHVYGELGTFAGRLQMRSPHIVPPERRGKVTAVYAGKPGQVSGEALEKGIGRAIHRLEDAEVLLLAQAGLLEEEFNELTGVKSAQTLLRLLHFPRDVAQGERARALARRLSLETVVRRAADAKLRPPVAGSAITISKHLVDELVFELPFPLTGDQRQAIDEIVKDLRSAYAMKRLLSGDVGTGKSITFQLPAAAAYSAGANVVILVPSQLLVSQMAKELRHLFPGLPVCEVVGGSGPLTEGILVGTTALLSRLKKAKTKIHFLIVDEQHKFSVEQKSALCQKFTNVLEATATAIPRTLALVNFGGMDVSVLRECPVKKQISTRIVGEEDQPRVDSFVAEVVQRKGQVAVIYPLVDNTGATEAEEGLESVVAASKKWEKRFPGRVGVLHGKLEAEEKDGVIQGMNEGRFDILVSSLVIEVGVTLPSLKAILINHPERFGLAQLHQLRGRVARKGGKGHMFLLADGGLQEDALERLQLLEQCTDGFQLAEADMDMRGFGDVNDDASTQSGTARTLFYNARLTHQEISQTAKRLGVKL